MSAGTTHRLLPPHLAAVVTLLLGSVMVLASLFPGTMGSVRVEAPTPSAVVAADVPLPEGADTDPPSDDSTDSAADPSADGNGPLNTALRTRPPRTPAPRTGDDRREADAHHRTTTDEAQTAPRAHALRAQAKHAAARTLTLTSPPTARRETSGEHDQDDHGYAHDDE
ncbi:hypothetical protein [Streptomyces soliscabiei]|uniref:hypothetical protein n=1 Tax=Streptomyces soliscabiei TaxID=588897 RepID=UPI0029AD39C4|nr:hypothetical protein [Streptomyces sp. NY05-11A]MDX2675376.1 hypothetical protein [Streptomyces sp. NY05-11A]